MLIYFRNTDMERREEDYTLFRSTEVIQPGEKFYYWDKGNKPWRKWLQDSTFCPIAEKVESWAKTIEEYLRAGLYCSQIVKNINGDYTWKTRKGWRRYIHLCGRNTVLNYMFRELICRSHFGKKKSFIPGKKTKRQQRCFFSAFELRLKPIFFQKLRRMLQYCFTDI